MGLEVQIQSLLFSLCYGLFFAFMLNLNYHYIFDGKLYYKIFVNLLFVLDLSLLYFLLLQYINHGVIHNYFLLMVLVGFFIGNIKTKVLRKYVLFSKIFLRRTKEKSEKEVTKEK